MTRRRPSPHTPFPPDLAEDLGKTELDGLVDGDVLEDALVDGGDLADRVVEGWTLDGVHLRDVRLVGTLLTRLKLIDVVLERCDLAGATWAEASLTRVRFVDCRLAGFSLTAGSIDDLHVVRCSGESPSVFGSTGRRWLVEESRLPELDGRELTLTGGAFAACQLPGSQWAHAHLSEVTFRETDLAGLVGAAGLGGASFDTTTLIGAAAALARHLRITLEPDDDTGDGDA